MDQPNFFSQGSPYLSHPLLTPERTAREVDFLLPQLDLHPSDRVLDVGCGPGRHSIELARRGLEVVGIDPSVAMIAAAKERAKAAGVTPEFRRVGGEFLRAREPFDAAICLFTTLGQISAKGENRGLLSRVCGALRPGGRFAVEVPQREWAVTHLKTAERFGQGKRYTDVERGYDPTDKVVTEVFKVVSPDAERTYMLRYRLYDRAELCDMLDQAGLELQAAFGDYADSPLQPDSPIMLLIARKQG
jgi:SAM-dependent methyltransferase